ncbi:TPA: hypothetical protein ACWQ48_005602, partial [Escherichia coli]
MIDAKVLEGVKSWLRFSGRLTSRSLAEKMNMPLSSMVYFLRDAVDAGVLTDRNGFYDIPRPRPVQAVRRKCSQEGAADDVQWCSFRKSLPWIEGHDIPS